MVIQKITIIHMNMRLNMARGMPQVGNKLACQKK